MVLTIIATREPGGTTRAPTTLRLRFAHLRSSPKAPRSSEQVRLLRMEPRCMGGSTDVDRCDLLNVSDEDSSFHSGHEARERSPRSTRLRHFRDSGRLRWARRASRSHDAASCYTRRSPAHRCNLSAHCDEKERRCGGAARLLLVSKISAPEQ